MFERAKNFLRKLTIKKLLKTIGTILIMPACILVFLVAWPLYVLFDVSVSCGDDDDDAMLPRKPLEEASGSAEPSS